MDPRLRKPKQRLLDGFPLVGADQHCCCRPVLCDRHLFVSDRKGFDQFIEPVFNLRNRQCLRATGMAWTQALARTSSRLASYGCWLLTVTSSPVMNVA